MSAHPLHVLQFGSSDELRLSRNVGAYVSEGLERRQRCLVVATQEHTAAFVEQLERRRIDPGAATRSGRLVLLDADEVAAALLAGGMPSRAKFEEIVGERLRIRGDSGARGLRAYGEIVGVYWAQARRDAAVLLEEIWNDAMHDADFSLYCSYPIGVFDRAFTADDVDGLMCSHGMMVSGLEAQAAETALESALDRVLGRNALMVRQLMRAPYRPRWSTLPKAEAAILWLRGNLSGYADEILAHAAGTYAELVAGA
jgi:hypothetical protein